MGANVKATVTLHFDDEYLSNILVTAFDGDYGGCWYWAEPKGENWLVTDGVGGVWKSCTVREKEASQPNGKKRWAVVDHAMVGRGIQHIIQAGGHDRLKVRLLAKDDDLDANDADTIIQFAMFGEEVYG